jgi:hypothetical protein
MTAKGQAMDERDRLMRTLSGTFPADAVMAANALTTTAFSARIIGQFERTGANSWDPSRFVEASDGAVIRIFPGVRVQVQGGLGWFRMRYRGGVSMFAWQPPEGEVPEDPQAVFVQTCVGPFRNAPGIGAKAFIAKTLDS